jgi:S1-C subfamily serine protease
MSTQLISPTYVTANCLERLNMLSTDSKINNLLYTKPKVRTSGPRIFSESKPHLAASNTSVQINGYASGTIVSKRELAFGSNEYFVATSASALHTKVAGNRERQLSVGSQVKVETPNGGTVSAKVISISRDSNIAILRFESNANIKAANFAQPKAGTKAYAAGFAGPQNAPTGSFTHNGLSVSRESAVVSSSGVSGPNTMGDIEIQAPTANGMRGGGIFDSEGNLIGINHGGSKPIKNSGGINLGDLLTRQQAKTRVISSDVVVDELKKAMDGCKSSCTSESAVDAPEVRWRPLGLGSRANQD